MSDEPQQDSPVNALETLEERLGEVIQLCEQLREENRQLREQNATVLAERARLLEDNERARSKVEAMLERIRTMEQG